MHDLIMRTWAERAQAELGAAQRFRSIGKRLKEYEVPSRISNIANKAAQDEERHAFLCAKIAVKWGHETGFEKPKDVPKTITHPWNHLPSQDVFLLDVILMCCITESFNASLLNSMYTQSKQSEESRIIHQILKDEVQHAQLGWAFLQLEAQRRDCSFVSNHLVDMLTIAIRNELFSSSHLLNDPSSYVHGVMPHQDRLPQFQATLKEVICPGFSHFGIDVTPVQHWIEEKQLNFAYQI